MKRIIECVPNYSEGRDRGVIDAIVAAIGAVEGVKVLDVDPGEATNRTVANRKRSSRRPSRVRRKPRN